ncbi:MAG TPA: hypothetical protein VN493_22635 [Thermoanaerobaculia bacterium]|nr:hypothetical protein [Thermoanaerobaculia bacterium]
MPDRKKSTPPPVPPVTPAEAEAQGICRTARSMLETIKAFLEVAYLNLPDPSDAEDMGEGRIPESLAFSLRGSIECAISDHLDPLMKLLRRAAKETPARLVRDWQKRQGKAKVH